MILVFVECTTDSVNDVSAQALTFARDLLVREGSPGVHAVVVGDLPAGALAACADQGVSVVHRASHASLDRYAARAWAACVEQVARQIGATIVLAAGTPRGNEVMAHVATRLDVAMAANAVAVASLSPVSVTRQMMGGSVLEDMALAGSPAVFTIAGHTKAAEPADVPAQTEVSELEPVITGAELRGQATRLDARATGDTAHLSTARVVVGAGRGAGGPDGFGPCIELASLLGGSLGVSRVVTTLGWRPHSEQVGQTGTRISPELYIPCGISGAIQHWAGCASSQQIMAVNTDPDAPMVTRANYAVIGDMHEVVPAIVDALRAQHH
ncbi:MAG TPA: electron transfer flavoprotein subunit alpha/FixB family protein [Candidatus Lustribacter sp.]|nr:electron transfer flavoprotein subunit alpha/FixB family protein [Candidatus Lustribacter sp.]